MPGAKQLAAASRGTGPGLTHTCILQQRHTLFKRAAAGHAAGAARACARLVHIFRQSASGRWYGSAASIAVS